MGRHDSPAGRHAQRPPCTAVTTHEEQLMLTVRFRPGFQQVLSSPPKLTSPAASPMAAGGGRGRRLRAAAGGLRLPAGQAWCAAAPRKGCGASGAARAGEAGGLGALWAAVDGWGAAQQAGGADGSLGMGAATGSCAEEQRSNHAGPRHERRLGVQDSCAIDRQQVGSRTGQAAAVQRPSPAARRHVPPTITASTARRLCSPGVQLAGYVCVVCVSREPCRQRSSRQGLLGGTGAGHDRNATGGAGACSPSVGREVAWRAWLQAVGLHTRPEWAGN